MRRALIPIGAFLLGSALLTGLYLAFFTVFEGWDYAALQFARDRASVVPIIITFGVQAALYAVLRLGVYAPASQFRPGGPIMGATGGTSTTVMVACCLHHVTSFLPVLGVSAATAFVARFQGPFLLGALAMNIGGILFMGLTLFKARRLQLGTQAA